MAIHDVTSCHGRSSASCPPASRPLQYADTYGSPPYVDSPSGWREAVHRHVCPCGGIRQGLRPLRTRVHVCQCAGIRVHAIDWRDSRRGCALQRRDSGRLHLRFLFLGLPLHGCKIWQEQLYGSMKALILKGRDDHLI